MKIMLSKALVLAVIVLFVGAGVVPSVHSETTIILDTIYVDECTVYNKFSPCSKYNFLPTIRDVLDNLRFRWKTIKIGDCVDMHYIGRYASNNSVFDSSYEDVNNKTGGYPLNVFVSLNSSEKSPKVGYKTVIERLAEGLIG